MSVKGKTQQLDVLVGPNYRSIVIFSPNPANWRGGGDEAEDAAGSDAAPINRRQLRQRPAAVCTADGRQKTVANRGFICFEPMAGITNSMNLAHKGLYKELQSIPPGDTWQESFWLRPAGF